MAKLATANTQLLAVPARADDLGTQHAAVAVGDEVLDDDALEAGVVGVEPHPLVAVEDLAGVHQAAGEVGVQQGGQAVPVVGVDDLRRGG